MQCRTNCQTLTPFATQADPEFSDAPEQELKQDQVYHFMSCIPEVCRLIPTSFGIHSEWKMYGGVSKGPGSSSSSCGFHVDGYSPACPSPY